MKNKEIKIKILCANASRKVSQTPHFLTQGRTGSRDNGHELEA